MFAATVIPDLVTRERERELRGYQWCQWVVPNIIIILSADFIHLCECV